MLFWNYLRLLILSAVRFSLRKSSFLCGKRTLSSTVIILQAISSTIILHLSAMEDIAWRIITVEDKVLYPFLKQGYRTLSSTVIILQAISSMADKSGSSNSNSNSQTSNSNYSFQTQTQTVDVYILKHQTQTQTLPVFV